MTFQCSVTGRRGAAAFAVTGNPLRPTLHTSKRGLIFNYPPGAQRRGPTDQRVAGKPASSCKIKRRACGACCLIRSRLDSVFFQFSNDQLTELKIQRPSFFKSLVDLHFYSRNVPQLGGAGRRGLGCGQRRRACSAEGGGGCVVSISQVQFI